MKSSNLKEIKLKLVDTNSMRAQKKFWKTCFYDIFSIIKADIKLEIRITRNSVNMNIF